MTLFWILDAISSFPLLVQLCVWLILALHLVPLLVVCVFASEDWVRFVTRCPSKGLPIVCLFLVASFHLFVAPIPPLSLFFRLSCAWIVSPDAALSGLLERYSSCVLLLMAWRAVSIYRDPRVLPSECLDMSGKVVLVTGGSLGGIGYESALRLAHKGATVVITTRSNQRGSAARDAMVEALRKEDPKGRGRGHVLHKPLDLASLEDVSRFARAFHSTHDRLDVLVCNAGFGMQSGMDATRDGFEPAAGVMHLGHFALFLSVAPLLRRTRGRLILTSSRGHYRASMEHLKDFSPTGTVKPGTMRAYHRAKLCNAMMAAEAQRRFGDAISCYSLHPGAVGTNIWTGSIIPLKPVNDYFSWLFNFYARLLMRTPGRGSMDIVFAAATRKAEKVAGCYLTDCVPTKPNPLVEDESACSELWDRSLALVEKHIVSMDETRGGTRRRRGR